jgi:hypothetical protein
VTHFEFPLTKLGAELERRVSRRLAEERGMDLGPAGVLHYVVDRGAFAVSIAGGSLVVEAPIRASAEACSGRRCYASCEPRGVARVELSLGLRSDYRFQPTRTSFRFTQGCRVRVLGGFLSIDITPTLHAEATRRLQRIAREIDRGLPDVRSEVERAYHQLSKPLNVPLAGCLALRPLGVVQGPIEDSTDTLRTRFAVQARPELRPECEQAVPVPPLPSLVADLSLPEEDVATVDMILPLSSFVGAFEGTAARSAQPSGEARARVHVTEAVVVPSGPRVDADLTLAGTVCGTVTLRAEPSYAGDGRFIGLQAAFLDEESRARARSVGLDTDVLASTLASGVRVTPPLPLEALRAAVPLLGPALSTPVVSVSVRVSSLHAAGADVRGDELVARVEARGSLHLAPK